MFVSFCAHAANITCFHYFQYGDVDSRVSSYLKKELLRISDKEKSWREKLWKNGVIKSSRLAPRACPQYVGTEEVGFVFLTYDK